MKKLEWAKSFFLGIDEGLPGNVQFGHMMVRLIVVLS